MKNILCVIDPTTSSQPALRRAVSFAKQIGGELELLICDYSSFLSGGHYFDSESLQKARAKLLEEHRLSLGEYAEEYRESGVDITVDAIWDYPLHEGIVRHAISSGADVVLKDTHKHPGLGLSGLSNSDWNLIRTCPLPLWLVKPFDFPENPKLIAAIDPLHERDKPAALDEDILRTAEMIASAIAGELHAFHAFDAVVMTQALSGTVDISTNISQASLEEKIRLRHQECFTKMIEKHGIRDAQAHLVAGETHQVLPVLAAEIGASLVVMGSVSRTLLKRVFVGSTAERTLDRLQCDLLIVKPAWFETPVNLDERFTD